MSKDEIPYKVVGREAQSELGNAVAEKRSQLIKNRSIAKRIHSALPGSRQQKHIYLPF
jgi:hypothetical protein